MLAAFVDSNGDWISRIYDYGPAALVVFVSVVLLTFSASQLKKKPDGRMERCIYVSNWVGLSALVVTTIVIWIIQHLGQQPPIRGVLGTLPAEFLVRAPMNDEDTPFYVRPELDARDHNALEYHWIISPKDWRNPPKRVQIEVFKQLGPNTTSGYDKTIQLDMNKTLY